MITVKIYHKENCGKEGIRSMSEDVESLAADRRTMTRIMGGKEGKKKVNTSRNRQETRRASGM